MQKLLKASSTALVAFLSLLVASTHAHEPSAANGRALYQGVIVPGNPNCASGGCHGPNPLLNINGVQNGDTPGGIALAISRVAQMSFLRGVLNTTQLEDLSAYIANPAAANVPAISVSEVALDFGSVTVGQSAPNRTLTISNTGELALVVSSIAVGSLEFSATGTGCAQIAPGSSCSVSVGFRPQSAGQKQTTLTIAHNAGGGNKTVALSGTGAISQATVEISANSIQFGRAFVGQLLFVDTVRVINTGAVPLNINGLDGFAPNFVLVANTCTVGAEVPPGGECRIEIGFVPQLATTFAATMSISHNGQGGVNTVSLGGTGVALPAGARLMVEYSIPALDYYFMTSRQAEQTLLDGIASFRRTRFAFPVYEAEAPSRASLSRYFFAEVARNASRGSHFYTAIDAEKAVLASLNPTNESIRGKGVNEGVDSWVSLPVVEGVGGSCAAGQQPVFRVFRGNTRFPDDPNHRFTAVRSVYETFVSNGWDNEGVKLCVPAP